MIPYSKQLIEQDDIDIVVDTLKSDYLTGGEKPKEFAHSLASYVGTKYASVLNSATSALFATYNAIGLKEGDEVITTAISFVATSNMILATGAKPVFVDISFDGNINPQKIQVAITQHTKAIVTVDYAGVSVDVKAIREIAIRYNLIWISDSSHSLGGEVDGKKVGSFADLSIFSFHAIKPITTFEGGAVVTNNKIYHDKIELFLSHGIVKKQFYNQDMIEFGYNLRLSAVASALGINQLKKLDTSIARREEIFEYYYDRFKNSQQIFINHPKPNIKSSHHLTPIMLDRSLWCPKEDIYKELISKGIGVQVHYKPIYQHSYYKKLYKNIRLLNSDEFYKSELSIPNHQGLSDSDVQMIADSIQEVLQKYSNSSCRF